MSSRAQPRISSRPESARAVSPAAASPAANASKGLIRLPPPRTAYRMAWCRRCGAIAVWGRKRSSAASTRAWTLAIQAVKSLVVGTGEIFQGIGFEYLDLLLSPREHSLAVLGELQAPFVSGQGLLQGELSRLHARDDLLQLGESRFEAFGLVGFCGLGSH